MNISQGDTTLMVRYIQAFLQEEYTETMRVSGIYDQYTHDNLMNYLELPNISTAYEVAQDEMNAFPELRTLFNVFFSPTEVQFISKTKSTAVKEFIQQEETYQNISTLAYEHGWHITNYVATEHSNPEKYEITLGTRGSVNVIPNRDLIPMINLFNNKYVNNLSIFDDGAGSGYLDEVTTGVNDDRVKLAYIDTEPNVTYSIYHGYPDYVQLTFASYDGNAVGAQSGDWVDNVQSLYLAPGEIYYYTASEAASMILIQIPWARNIEGILYSDVALKLGDFNLDGNVDTQDLLELEEMLEIKAETEIPEKREKALALLAKYNPMQFAAVNFTDKVEYPTYENITQADATILRQYLDGSISEIETDQYGNPVYTRQYAQRIDNSKVKYSNIIGITKGEYTTAELPTKEFVEEHWAVQDKFIDYITLMAITPYSAEYDIRTAQRLLDNILPLRSMYFDEEAHEYPYILDKDGNLFNDRGPDGVYTDKLKELITAFQIDRGIYYHTGYIDKDTESRIELEYEMKKFGR